MKNSITQITEDFIKKIGEIFKESEKLYESEEKIKLQTQNSATSLVELYIKTYIVRKNMYDNVGKRAFVGSSQKNDEKVPFASIKLSLKNLSKKREKPRIHRGFTACIFFFMLRWRLL